MSHVPSFQGRQCETLYQQHCATVVLSIEAAAGVAAARVAAARVAAARVAAARVAAAAKKDPRIFLPILPLRLPL